MFRDIMLKLASVLTPDDVRRMKAAGLGGLAKEHIDGLGKLAVRWQEEANREQLDLDLWQIEGWDEVQIRLSELRAMLGRRRS
jgi:hypothetical protein